MERVELIEDLDVRGFCAQGTVGAGGTIPMFTVWFQREGLRQRDPDGSVAAGSSSYRCGS
jgi:hypothetical protein